MKAPTLIAFFILHVLSGSLLSQTCSNEALSAKYWQYRETFNKHFILIDRDTSGCVHDGIGQDPDDPCHCIRHGYSLPATSINQTANGAIDGLGDRNMAGSIWYNPECGDDDGDPATPETSWADNAKHNHLEVTSETPHQMGWYWVLLASEYVLLMENGQTREAQRTLEELFLGLQAYRRLDITANCLAAARYQEITDNYETSDDCGNNGKACLCGIKYQGNTTKNFDSPCGKGCAFTPNTSGYSGFFLREDATQELEKLHDDSEDKWNIDAVGSAYSMSLKPPCTTVFSQACYNVHRQNFMSQDGVIGLMIGLAMIRRLIPEHAAVYTCEGATYYPYQMAVKIASAMVNRIDNTWLDKISWPGSYACCDKEVFFSEHDGGVAIATMTGLKKACSYIDGAERHNDAAELVAWHALTEQTRKLVHGYMISIPFVTTASLVQANFGDNANFWVRLKTLGWDMGGAGKHSLYQDAFREKNLQIMPIINNLLFPAKPDLGIDKAYYRQLLCDAPCEGPCKQQQGYPNSEHPENFPVYDCPNTPGWVGQRWETHGEDSNASRQFNGLDYMALFNLYLLYFPEERTAYYNPRRPDLSAGGFSGEYTIQGPGFLCPGTTAVYSVKPGSPSSLLESISWESSAHFTLASPSTNPATVNYSFPAAPGYPFVSATFWEIRQIPQYYSVDVNPFVFQKILLPFDPATLNYFQPVLETCSFTYFKPISSGEQEYFIERELDHCAGNYWFHAQGAPASDYQWHIVAVPTDTSLSTLSVEGSGADFNYSHPRFPGKQGELRINLHVVNPCGAYNSSRIFPYKCADPDMHLRVVPNPAQDNISIHFIRDDGNSFDIEQPDGIMIRIIPAVGGADIIKQRIFQNGTQIAIAGLPNGVYKVVADAADTSLLSGNLVIMR